MTLTPSCSSLRVKKARGAALRIGDVHARAVLVPLERQGRREGGCRSPGSTSSIRAPTSRGGTDACRRGPSRRSSSRPSRSPAGQGEPAPARSVSGSPLPTSHRSAWSTPFTRPRLRSARVRIVQSSGSRSNSAIESSSFWLEAGGRPTPARLRYQNSPLAPTATENGRSPTIESSFVTHQGVARLATAPEAGWASRPMPRTATMSSAAHARPGDRHRGMVTAWRTALVQSTKSTAGGSRTSPCSLPFLHRQRVEPRTADAVEGNPRACAERSADGRSGWP